MQASEGYAVAAGVAIIVIPSIVDKEETGR